MYEAPSGGKGGVGALVAGLIGLVAGFALGAVAGAPLLGAVMAQLR
jgi:hypothetical protein